MGQTEHAMSLLELLVEQIPGEQSLERDLGAVMRRKGMVRDLADRYLERAQSLIREGRTQEAIGWLREILQLDRNRKDVARLIRDLRFQEQSLAKSRQVRWRVVLGALALSLASSVLILREIKLLEEYRHLPPVVDGSPTSIQERLASLERFIDANPAWHRSFHVVKERSALRLDLDRLEERRLVLQQREEQNARERVLSAEAAMHRAHAFVDSREWSRALVEFEQALELGGEDWPEWDQVKRDVEAISKYLTEETEEGEE